MAACELCDQLNGIFVIRDNTDDQQREFDFVHDAYGDNYNTLRCTIFEQANKCLLCGEGGHTSLGQCRDYAQALYIYIYIFNLYARPRRLASP